MGFGELALQAERARNLRAHLLRRARAGGHFASWRESAPRTPAGLSNPTARRLRSEGVDWAAAGVVNDPRVRAGGQAPSLAAGTDCRRRARARASAAATAAVRAAAAVRRAGRRRGQRRLPMRSLRATLRSPAARASLRLHARPACTIAMQSTGQGGIRARTRCIARPAPCACASRADDRIDRARVDACSRCMSPRRSGRRRAQAQVGVLTPRILPSFGVAMGRVAGRLEYLALRAPAFALGAAPAWLMAPADRLLDSRSGTEQREPTCRVLIRPVSAPASSRSRRP